jgi:hypothetical protein
MIPGMSPAETTHEPAANTLCKSCGLCCTGHLFSRTKLRSAELDSAQALGLNVFRSHPSERGFSQPCPLWHGQCTIYDSPEYPRFCRTYKCKLLKQVLAETTPLPEALRAIADAKQMIQEMEPHLPAAAFPSFRERLEAALENDELRNTVAPLLDVYRNIFGVDDLVDLPEEP